LSLNGSRVSMSSIVGRPESPGGLTAVDLSRRLTELVDQMTNEHEPQARPESPRRPYVTPVLKIFGGVAGMTGTNTMAGTLMDGGPNNSKT
jgi:hypothetical protein